MRRTDSGHQVSGLVSVVIPFLNAEKFIREAIESVFAQTYENWELLLVDDGSVDGSVDIAVGCSSRFPTKVRYLEHEGHENRGTAASRNLGIHHAKGVYIAFLDSDDAWLPSKLKRQVAILDANPTVSMVYGPVQFWFGWSERTEDLGNDFILELNIQGERTYEPPDLLVLFLQEDTPVPLPSSLMMRCDAIQRIGGFEEDFKSALQLYEDSAFSAKVLLREAVFVSGECWTKYRQHPNSCAAIWARAGEYHPERPHSARRYFLDWLEEYFHAQEVKNARLWRALTKQLKPYRHSFLDFLSKKGRFAANLLKWSFCRLQIYFWAHRRSFFQGCSGEITANPNPIQIEMGSRTILGVTTLTWTSVGPKAVEVRVDAPDGPLFSRSGPSGRATTGRWVRNGMAFYLQDVSNGDPLKLTNTLSAVKVRCIDVAGELDGSYLRTNSDDSFFIKAGYVPRHLPEYFEDTITDVVYQPEVYPFADFLGRRLNCTHIIDIGCGSGKKLMRLYPRFEIIGFDHGPNLAFCRSEYKFGTWFECDLERPDRISLPEEVLKRSIVVCADVIEHLVNPIHLLHNLKYLLDYAKLCILTTPERDLSNGEKDMGPPMNPSHVREWNTEEFRKLLLSLGFDIPFMGLTASDNKTYEKRTIMAVIGSVTAWQSLHSKSS